MYGILRVPYLISQPSPFPTTCPGGGSSLLWRSEMPLRWFGGCIGKRNRARPTSLVLPLFVSSVQPRAREAEEKRRRWLFSLSFVSMVAWAASLPPSLPPTILLLPPSLPSGNVVRVHGDGRRGRSPFVTAPGQKEEEEKRKRTIFFLNNGYICSDARTGGGTQWL